MFTAIQTAVSLIVYEASSADPPQESVKLKTGHQGGHRDATSLQEIFGRLQRRRSSSCARDEAQNDRDKKLSAVNLSHRDKIANKKNQF